MLEAEFAELNNYVLDASKVIADYHDKLNDLTDKDKRYIIEKILAKVDIVLVFTMTLRHQLLQQLSSVPASTKIQMNQALNELKSTADTAKTLSFNFTAVYYSVRDAIKGAIE